MDLGDVLVLENGLGCRLEYGDDNDVIEFAYIVVDVVEEEDLLLVNVLVVDINSFFIVLNLVLNDLFWLLDIILRV